MDMIVFLNVKPEDHDNFALALEKAFTDKEANAIVKDAEIQKQKKADYDKKRYEEKKKSTVKNVNSDKEKREEKEGILPLDSPSSLPSFPPDPLINYPITPFNPPLPEEKGERKESFLAVETKSGEQQRRVTEPFGNYVRLTPEEYGKLCEKFGNGKADEMIQRMDNYVGEDPKRQKKYETRNHYLTLLNWERMDQERKTQPLMMQKPQTTFVKPEPKKTYDFTDVLEMRRQKQEQDVIDL